MTRCFGITALAAAVAVWLGGVPAVAAVPAWEGDGLRMEIESLPSEAVEAFFIGRGFAKERASEAAREGCIFRAAIGHGAAGRGPSPTEVDLREWEIRVGSERLRLRTREYWEALWRERGTAEDVRAAFRWSLFPTTQRFGPADHNWGMISFGLPPETRFDLMVRWHAGGAEHSRTLVGLVCAP